MSQHQVGQGRDHAVANKCSVSKQQILAADDLTIDLLGGVSVFSFSKQIELRDRRRGRSTNKYGSVVSIKQ
jgi:hypothetical protein